MHFFGSKDGLFRACVEWPFDPAVELAERLLREFLANQFFTPLAIALELDDAELRVNLAASQLVGLGIARYVLRVEPLASLPSDATVACIAPTIEAYLTAPLGRAV